ncbi:hypothetical protein PI125_g20808 [Phytophthora idaei]|nr:hypothetical protein PI125_g20808 [Phytophthora idaei]KAG3133623.1 hypothetical protein PI126_g19087 [Phytophthora idaei]
MAFIFGLPPDSVGRNGVLVFVDRFSKMVHLVPVADAVTAEESAAHFVDMAFRHHSLPESIVSDRDPRFTSAFWSRLFGLLGTRLLMSTAAHPETDGQTERVNRVLEDVLRSYATSFTSWSSFLPLTEFALNNAVHSSTGLTPFFVNNARHPRVPAQLAVGRPTESPGSALGGREAVLAAADAAARSSSTRDASEAEDFLLRRVAEASSPIQLRNSSVRHVRPGRPVADESEGGPPILFQGEWPVTNPEGTPRRRGAQYLRLRNGQSSN